MEAALAPATARTCVVGASVTGPGHVRRGVTCEDRFSAEVLDDATVLVAVSDGLGVAAHAGTGAETASGAAIRAGRALLTAAPDLGLEDVVRQMVACARAAVTAHADAMQVGVTDLACTLVVVVARADAVACGHVGDGAAIVERDTFDVLSAPPAREYVNETGALTDGVLEVRVSAASGPIRSVTLLTDGCQHAALAPDGSVGAAFIPPIVHAMRDGALGEETLHRLLEGPKVSEHSDDDKTLVVALL